MAYRQLKPANPGVPGKSGYCLVYARTVFGVASKYASASLAYRAAQYKHTGALPSDVAVPVWFSWKTDGHVAVSVPGKGVYSTTSQGVKVFPTPAACATYIGGGCKYVGWSEDINGVRVVQPTVVSPPSTPSGNLPAVGKKIHLIPTQTRTTYRVGTANVAGQIKVTDNTFDYVIRGYDSKYPGRAIINSASAGGNGVGLALFYLNGSRVDGWKEL